MASFECGLLSNTPPSLFLYLSSLSAGSSAKNMRPQSPVSMSRSPQKVGSPYRPLWVSFFFWSIIFLLFLPVDLSQRRPRGGPLCCTASVLPACSRVFILLCVKPRPGSLALLLTKAANCPAAADLVLFMTRLSQQGLKREPLEGICKTACRIDLC